MRAATSPDDFRHRMLANIAAFAFTMALTAIGVWLAASIADLRRTQDCVLMGRLDCAKISTPHSRADFRATPAARAQIPIRRFSGAIELRDRSVIRAFASGRGVRRRGATPTPRATLDNISNISKA